MIFMFLDSFKVLYPNQKKNFLLIAVLFFNIGFFTSINGVLIAYFKDFFKLSYFISNVIPFVFFLAYLLMSQSFGVIAYKHSYGKALIIGLIFGIIGCLFFILGVYNKNFYIILLGLFFIASFATGLEVSSNPLVDCMGPVNFSSQRLTVVHFFDSVGTIIGPQFAAFIFLYSVSQQQLNYRIITFYLLLIVIFIAFVLLVDNLFCKPKRIIDKIDINYPINTTLLHCKQLTYGVIAIFVYVGCEVSIANFLIMFAIQPQTSHLSLGRAAVFLSLYWCNQMLGRFIAIFCLRKMKTRFTLAYCGILATSLLICALLLNGSISLYLITLVGLTNSIMYPYIFSIAIEDLGNLKAKASGYLHMGVVGGALIPLLQGITADHFGVIFSFWVPAALYLYVTLYASVLSVKK